MRTANENVVRALAKALTDARAGNIEAVAIITASPDGEPDVRFAGESELVASVNIGVDMLKAQIVHTVMATKVQPTVSIRRPVGGGTPSRMRDGDPVLDG